MAEVNPAKALSPEEALEKVQDFLLVIQDCGQHSNCNCEELAKEALIALRGV